MYAHQLTLGRGNSGQRSPSTARRIRLRSSVVHVRDVELGARSCCSCAQSPDHGGARWVVRRLHAVPSGQPGRRARPAAFANARRRHRHDTKVSIRPVSGPYVSPTPAATANAATNPIAVATAPHLGVPTADSPASRPWNNEAAASLRAVPRRRDQTHHSAVASTTAASPADNRAVQEVESLPYS